MFASPYNIVGRLSKVNWCMKTLNKEEKSFIQGGSICSSLVDATWSDIPSWTVRAINMLGIALGCWA